uniref:Uncharacterized protein n=1 Tax=Wuchereria bancrofti TaxID=6293 RepID=A0AAF5Q578_WUCBA
MKKEMNDYCSDDCKHAMRECLHESASDWDSFISILQKLTINFDKGFTELEKGIIRSISYAMEMKAPVIAKTVLKKCGRINFAKAPDTIRHIDYHKPDPVQRRAVFMIRQLEKGIIRSISYAMEMKAPVIAKTVLKKCGRINFAKAPDTIRHIDYHKPDPVQRRAVFMIRQLEKGIIRSISYAMEMKAPVIAKTVLKKCGRINFAKAPDTIRHIDYHKPDPVQRRAVFMIRQFTTYVAWWRQLVNNICNDPSRTSKCWNNTVSIDR